MEQDFRRLINEVKIRFNVTQKDIAEALDISQSYLTDIIRGRAEPTTAILDKIRQIYKIDEGADLSQGHPVIEDFTGSNGMPIGDGQVSQSTISGRMSVPGIDQPGTVFIRVLGDSMLCPERPEGSIPSGAFVSLRPSSLSTFRWGELYALVTTDGVLIKKVMPADDPDHITCVSLNAEKYPPFQLCQEEVAEAWRVTGIVTVRLK